MDMIWETVWPIFGLGAGATYCPYTALMWAVWPISCEYIAHTVANIWATKSFLDGSCGAYTNFLYEERKMRRLFFAHRAYSTHFPRRVEKIIFQSSSILTSFE